MKASELVRKARNIAEHHKTLYVMGCFGAPMTDSNKSYYCQHYEYNRRPERTEMIQKASPDTFGFDCVCLIKGILWGWNGDATQPRGGAVYESHGVPDIDADQMIGRCTRVSTSGWSRMKPGEAVWMEGHIGIYIGGGLVVECSPRWDNKVQITAVGNTNGKAGYHTRVWTKHGQLPWVIYEKNLWERLLEYLRDLLRRLVDLFFW